MKFLRMRPGYGEQLIAEGDVEVAEDEERRAQDDIQKLTDRSIADIDKLLQQKESDLMAV